MVPKNISFSVPTRAALILAPPLVMVSKIVKPVIWTLNGIANSILRLFKVEPKDEATSAYTLDEVANIVEQSTRDGMLSDTTGALTAAFEFTAKTVADVEVPIGEMVLLPADCDAGRHPAAPSPSTATPATSSRTTTATPPVTCTSRTSWT